MNLYEKKSGERAEPARVCLNAYVYLCMCLYEQANKHLRFIIICFNSATLVPFYSINTAKKYRLSILSIDYEAMSSNLKII